MMKRHKISLNRRKSLMGYLFLLPWLTGIILFFLNPLITTIVYSFSKLDMGTLVLSTVGTKNFYDAIYTDAQFPVLLTAGIQESLLKTPLILIFSFFIAMLLRKKMRGSTIIKAIFFITVILASDVFLQMQNETSVLNDEPVKNIMQESGEIFKTMESLSITKYLVGIGINPGWIDYINGAIRNITSITIHSGIQIFIFLAGLHSIPSSMYEAANIEGATAWETIWKITVPLMTPLILVNLIYTIVDSFSTLVNPLLRYISDAAFTGFNFGYSAALSIIYFATILILLGVVTLFMRKRIQYQG